LYKVGQQISKSLLILNEIGEKSWLIPNYCFNTPSSIELMKS